MSDVEPGKAKAAGIVGIIIGVTGLVNFICGCIYTSFGPKDASGLWSGIGQIIIGILGIVTWLKLNKMTFVFFLVFNILWLIILIIQVVVALIAWLIWYVIRKVVETNCSESPQGCVCNADKSLPIGVDKCSDIKTIESCVIAIVITSSLAVILTFAGSIIGCMGVCCAKPQTNVVVVQQPGIVMTTTTTTTPAAVEAPPEYPVKY
ncbi:hypothetical protein P5673_000684 [Acropora cervicornis]|uniref:Transmembrane protein n=1 Tax=Acropora cervicornis TaxID=6130 RepID=A0AAD9VI13_ACRCE|nr:uncharacterized protein LOC114959868 [Acropora millepora]KAK2574505.1 hypothetical protein P5673_000684 [Acropora cervicornis]